MLETGVKVTKLDSVRYYGGLPDERAPRHLGREGEAPAEKAA
jgi:hypothetical protein